MSSGTGQTAGAGGLDGNALQIGQDTPSSAGARPAPRCSNCGTPLSGSYCSECGQRHLEHPVHHFWHFVGEAIEDLTHADSRLWRTLIALLFRPGLLTREFLDGHRVRYLPPVRLYLVVSVIFFVVVGLQSQSPGPGIRFADNGASLQHKVAAARALARTPAQVANGLTALAGNRGQRRHTCNEAGTYLGRHGGWLAQFGPRLARSCLAVSANGGRERLAQAIGHNLERAMFLFLPLLALVMKPLYLNPPRHYVEHLLFFVHNHAFLFVVVGLSALLDVISSSSRVLDPLDAAITIYIPIYFYVAMRRVYAQDRWLTLGKLTVLGIAYFFVGMLMFIATLSYSFLML